MGLLLGVGGEGCRDSKTSSSCDFFSSSVASSSFLFIRSGELFGPEVGTSDTDGLGVPGEGLENSKEGELL